MFKHQVNQVSRSGLNAALLELFILLAVALPAINDSC